MAVMTDKEHERRVRMSGAKCRLSRHVFEELPEEFPELTTVELSAVLQELSLDILKKEMQE